MTRPTVHSLPGIGCELRMTVSSAPTFKKRASPRDNFERAASGSPGSGPTAPATKLAGLLAAPAGQLARVIGAYSTKEAA